MPRGRRVEKQMRMERKRASRGSRDYIRYLRSVLILSYVLHVPLLREQSNNPEWRVLLSGFVIFVPLES